MDESFVRRAGLQVPLPSKMIMEISSKFSVNTARSLPLL
jgi:hypothetical protein